MRILLVALSVLVISTCGREKSLGSGDLANCNGNTADDKGHICLNGQWRITEDGECGVLADGTKVSGCPSNYTCQANVCIPSPTNPLIWFATDPIQPGTATSGLGSNQDYIYNIMAKGYSSLDDWCMSQAQQSKLPTIRNITSWKALIIAQPDNNPNQLGTDGAARFSLLNFSLVGGLPQIPYNMPDGTQSLSGNSLKMEDKHGDVYLNSKSTGFWTGLGASGGPPSIWQCNTNPYVGFTKHTWILPKNFVVPVASSSTCGYNNNVWSNNQSNVGGSMVIIPYPQDCVSSPNAIAFLETGDAGLNGNGVSCQESTWGCTVTACPYSYTVDTTPSLGDIGSCSSDNPLSANCSGFKPIICLSNG